MTGPVVTVVIPVYNGENFLRYSLASVIAQTYKNLEVIIVDDGSADANYIDELIDELNDPRIRKIRKPNGGVSSALNAGLNAANGKYFCWLSHDDVIPQDKISRQVKTLDQHYEKSQIPAIVFGNWDHIDENGKYIRFCDVQPELSLIKTSLGPIERQLLNACTCMWALELFSKVGNFDESLRFTQDYEFFFRLASVGVKWIYLPEILCSTRLHAGQDTVNKPIESEMNRLWSNIARFFHNEIMNDSQGVYKKRSILEYHDFVESQGLIGAVKYLSQYIRYTKILSWMKFSKNHKIWR